MSKFTLLKRTYPTSKVDRECDGYKYIMESFTKEQRDAAGIDESKLKKIIYSGETYMYQVGKEDGEFKTKYISLENFEIIRMKFFGNQDD